MYISTDNGVTTGYNNAVAAVSMAYYTVTLPVGGEYAVTFDWRARGEVNSDLLSVCLVDNPAEVIAAGAASTLPSWYTQTVKGTRQGSGIWGDFSFKLVGTGQPQRIVFIWQNDANGTGSTPAGAVDNFYIRELTPTNYFCGFDDPVENAKWQLRSEERRVGKEC